MYFKISSTKLNGKREKLFKSTPCGPKPLTFYNPPPPPAQTMLNQFNLEVNVNGLCHRTYSNYFRVESVNKICKKPVKEKDR